jgi:hypothetical protein
MNLEKELSTSLELMDMGIDAELHRGDDGTVSVRPRQARLGATGFDLQPPIRQEMSQAEPQTLEQSMEELPAVVGGLAAGATSATVGLPGDIAALAAGAYNAIFPEGDEGRLEAFTNTLTEISDKYGSGAVKGFIQQQAEEAGLSDVQMQALDEAMMVGEFGGIGGVAKAAVTKGPQMLSKVGDAIEGAGDAAKARMADADGSFTAGMGVDPDPAIAAAGDAVKAARARYEASPNDPATRRAYLDARHERDAQLSSMPVEEKLRTDTSYRMAHQPTTPQNGAARLDDITGGGTVFPDDVYTGDAVRLYGGNNPADKESAKVIQSAKGNPEAEVTIYRAVPQGVDTINPGDFVTLSKRYADDHALSGYGPMGDDRGVVISQKVKVKDVYSDGNDLNEFGYFPEDIAETNVAKLEPPTETEPGIIAFHGSGSDFDEFKLKKIGTGEGAQAYGYGLYFTESEDIARFYRDSIRATQDMAGKIDVTYKGKPFEDLGDTAAAEDAGPEYQAITGILERMNKGQPRGEAKKDIIKVIEGQIRNLPSDGDDELTGLLKSSFQSELDAIRSVDVNDIVKSKGKMYKVAIEPKPEDMLDYQATFADQPKKVQDALKAVGYQVEKNLVGQKNPKSQIDLAMRRPMPMVLDSLKGRIIDDIKMGKIEPGKADKILSEKLLEQGVPGIKYRAAGSRAASVDAADAEMNYVVFDDKMIKILEKYGIVGPVAIGAVTASQQEGEVDDAGA